MKGWKGNLFLFGIYFLLAYPLFYYSYKHGTPEFGGKDFYSYYKLYANWDFPHVDAPFNQRVLSSFAIFLIHKSGLHYSTETAVSHIGIDPQVYFSALFFNFLCVIITCIIIYRMIEKNLKGPALFPFIGSALLLFGFGTLTFLISGLSDGLSILLFSLAFKMILEHDMKVMLVFIAAIFQREYLLLVFGMVSLLYWWKYTSERRFFRWVFISCVACFIVYFICRKTVFFTPRYQNQLDASSFLNNMMETVRGLKGYFMQTFMLQNLVIAYFGVCLYKWINKQQVNRFFIAVTLLIILQTVLLSFILALGNNAGRYLYMTMPFVIYYLMYELRPFMNRE